MALARSEDTIGEVVNIGSGVEVSVRETLEMIKKIMGSDVEFITDEQRLRPKGSEVLRLCCDNSKLRQLTGFVPEYSLERGLGKTIDWFTDTGNLSGYKADIYNV